MDIQTASIILLALEITSLIFITRVLFIQYPLLRAPDDEGVRLLRFVLFFLALTLFIGTLISCGANATTAFFTASAGTPINPVRLIYTFSNAITDVISAVLVWLIYRVTSMASEKMISKNKILSDKNIKLTKQNGEK